LNNALEINGTIVVFAIQGCPEKKRTNFNAPSFRNSISNRFTGFSPKCSETKGLRTTAIKLKEKRKLSLQLFYCKGFAQLQ